VGMALCSCLLHEMLLCLLQRSYSTLFLTECIVPLLCQDTGHRQEGAALLVVQPMRCRTLPVPSMMTVPHRLVTLPSLIDAYGVVLATWARSSRIARPPAFALSLLCRFVVAWAVALPLGNCTYDVGNKFQQQEG
jgi:hypothetical protein